MEEIDLESKQLLLEEEFLRKEKEEYKLLFNIDNEKIRYKDSIEDYGYTRKFTISDTKCGVLDSLGILYFVKNKKVYQFNPITEKETILLEINFIPNKIKVNSLGTKLLLIRIIENEDNYFEIYDVRSKRRLFSQTEHIDGFIITENNFSFDMTTGNWLIYMPDFNVRNCYLFDLIKNKREHITSEVVDINSFIKDEIIFSINYPNIYRNNLISNIKRNLYFDKESYNFINFVGKNYQQDFGRRNYFYQQISENEVYIITEISVNPSNGENQVLRKININDGNWSKEGEDKKIVSSEYYGIITDEFSFRYYKDNNNNNSFAIDPITEDLFILSDEMAINENNQNDAKYPVLYKFVYNKKYGMYLKTSQLNLINIKGINISFNSKVLLSQSKDVLSIYLKKLDNDNTNLLGRELIWERLTNPIGKSITVEDQEGATRKYDLRILTRISNTIKNAIEDNPGENYPLYSEMYSFTLEEFEEIIRDVIFEEVKNYDNLLLKQLDINY